MIGIKTAIITSLVATIIFFIILRLVYKKNKKKKVEIKILEEAVNKKISKDIQDRVLNVAIYYYAVLFFIANYIAFYTSNLILLTIYSLGIFLIGLFLGYKILIFYGKRIATK